jgi:hypothetical protein
MVFNKLGEKLKTWWNNFTMSPEERWLAQSTDIVELENKLRRLWEPHYNDYSKLGGI